MHKFILDESNFLIYAAQNYTNLNCTDTDEFLEDLKRIGYIKKLLLGYKKTKVLKTRLILNHLIVLYNVFYPRALTNILLFKISDCTTELLSFLRLLSYVAETDARAYDLDIERELKETLNIK